MELLSHPEKTLNSHLSEVANVALKTIKGKELNLSFNYDGKDVDVSKLIIDLVYLSAAFHDLGKGTSFFQDYIRNLDKMHDKKKSHALLSAVFVFYVTDKFLKTKGLNNELAKLLSSFTFSAVKRHHGRLGNLADEVLISSEWRNLLPELVQNINSEKIQELINNKISNYSFKIDWNSFVAFILNETYNDILEDFSFDILQESYSEIDSNSKITLFYIHQLIYSTLLFSDKNEVVLSDTKTTVNQSNVIQNIEAYRESNGFNKPKSEINKLKNEAFYSSLEQLEKVFNKNQHIYSVTLPTGLGKTITAFNIADKMRKLAGFENSKIIINIPFTSIIDQNFEVYADILNTHDTDVLLKHHHLAEPVYKTSEKVSDFFQSKFLIETWQSDTVVTTFVQLLETLLSCDKAKLMKFSHLANSVILLDEIQTIPYEYWETIRESFKILGEKLNVYFILISATQPLIFTPGEDIIELVPDYKKYFLFFNRTKLIVNGKIGFDEFKTTLLEYIQNNPTKDVLVIVNTKKAASETFKFICEEIDTSITETYFLTTLITPYERKEIINRIKKTSTQQKVIISTQLVEAGVDISVDTVFRQLSPIDSIIQAAGRANRYNEKPGISEVYVYDIEDYRKSSNFVYGSDLLLKTENVLKGFREVEEKDYIHLIEKYFIEVRKQSDNTSQPILNAIKNLDFSLVDFELIENRNTESIYIQLNERAKEIWQEYLIICKTEKLTPWERDAVFSKIKTEFYDFVINVPIPYDSKMIDFDSEKLFNFYVSELNSPSQNYNYSSDDFTQNRGYVASENTTYIL
ncbi:CRISPR-associated helicase Cas3' [Draconibacterium orientale]|uniref:CRISPR-associated helicase Cas3' n=1 Tax=Draconibacterium orientale TaxID=1168034 RepID=UPI002ABD886E|nr:CRISPR-associated helicase Cas3' [Draconibacterium orientale]